MSLFNYFVGLIYVTETEHDAVMRMHEWKEHKFDNDDQIYYLASFTREGKEFSVCAAKQNEMGMTSAATLSMKIIEHFRPQYLIMPGIAAGTGINESDGQIYGDVLLADVVWNYSNGKYVEPQASDIKFGTVGFIPRPTIVKTDKEILPYLKKAIELPENQCHVHLGPLASGSTVVANSEIVEKQITRQFRQTKGLEMEGYGVAYAAKNATAPRPYAIIAKSICDFANQRKNDNYQKFAAYTSCEFVKLMYEKVLPDRIV